MPDRSDPPAGPASFEKRSTPAGSSTSPAGLQVTIRSPDDPLWQPVQGRDLKITRALALLVVGPGGKELLLVPAGVTAAELRDPGFHDVADRMEGKPASAPGRHQRCTFCDKTRREVAWLIARQKGPDVFICDECIGLCNDMLAREKAAKTEVSGG